MYGNNRNNRNQGRGNQGNQRGGSGYGNSRMGSNYGRNLPGLMDLNNGRSRGGGSDYRMSNYGGNDYGMSMGGGSSGYSSNQKTQEQKAFDSEFEKWEKSFDDWKIANRNHPDPEQYRYYENKFLQVRQKLITKRNEIYSTPPELPFEKQLSAADAMASSILSKFCDTRFNNSSSRDDSLPSLLGMDIIGLSRAMNNSGPGYGQGYGGDFQDRPSRFGPMFDRRDGPMRNDRFGGGNRAGGANSFGRDGPRRQDTQKTRPSQKAVTGQNVPEKKKRVKKCSSNPPSEESNEVYYAKLDDLYKHATTEECPRFLSGAGMRRVRHIQQKEEKDRTENEKRLYEIFDIIQEKRKIYFAKIDKEKAEKGENVEIKDSKKSEDVEMKESEKAEA